MANGFIKSNGEIDWDALRVIDNNQVLVGTTTNSGNDYSVNLSQFITGYRDIMGVTVKINADSTGASTLNINSLGPIPLKTASGSNVTTLKVNGVYTFRYNSSTGNFILQGEGVDVEPLITSVNTIFGM